MCNARYLTFVFLFAVAATQAAERFPAKHPMSLKEAQAQGLQRLSAEDLKAFIPGTQESKGPKAPGGVGGGKLRIFNPDGSFEAQAKQQRTGKWRIDSKSNAWCRSLDSSPNMPMQASDEHCFAVFRAPDGVHYFDYDIGDTLYAGVWRPQSK